MTTPPPATAQGERRIGLICASITTLLWGFLAIAMKVAATDVPVMSIVWFRFTFAFAVLAAFIARRNPGRLGILRRPPGLALLAALALTLNYIGYMAGLDHTTPTNAQILIQTAPLMLALIGIFLFKERMNRAQIIGVALAMAGFALFAWDQSQAAIVSDEALFRGNLLIFGAAITWALYAALQKVLTGRGHAPQDLNLILYAVPAIVLIPFADFPLLAQLTPSTWLLLIFLGANTLFAYGLLGEALKRLPAWQISLIITMNPLITLATMELLKPMQLPWLPADHVGLPGYAAALLVVASVVWVLLKKSAEPA